jgi:hypothetical protein
MKIYIDNYNTTNLAGKLSNIERVIRAEYKKNMFFSTSGIYTLRKNQIFKISTKDENNVQFTNVKINNSTNQLIIDHSYDEYDIKYNIPYDSYEMNFIEQTYSITPNDSINLVILLQNKPTNQLTELMNKNNNNSSLIVKDFYFTVNTSTSTNTRTNTNKNNVPIDMKIVTKIVSEFLSLLK